MKRRKKKESRLDRYISKYDSLNVDEIPEEDLMGLHSRLRKASVFRTSFGIVILVVCLAVLFSVRW